MLRRALSVLAFGFAGALLCASAASAATVSIAFGTTSNVVATGTGGATYNTSGTGYSVSIGGIGQPAFNVLASNTLDFESFNLSPSTFNIYVTSTGNTGAVGTQPFLSSFTSQLLPAGWTLTEATYYSSSNAAFGMTGPLSSSTFTGTGSATSIASAVLTGLYSVTEVYQLQVSGSGTVNSTIDLAPVPLPGSLPLFATGLGGLALLLLRRKNAALPLA
jgi:hypothetical protein